jgi:hypothetical protein
VTSVADAGKNCGAGYIFYYRRSAAGDPGDPEWLVGADSDAPLAMPSAAKPIQQAAPAKSKGTWFKPQDLMLQQAILESVQESARTSATGGDVKEKGPVPDQDDVAMQDASKDGGKGKKDEQDDNESEEEEEDDGGPRSDD